MSPSRASQLIPARKRRVISHKNLRIFANHLARICTELDILEFDVLCEFTPRRRPEYASVETRVANGASGRSGEDVIASPVAVRNTPSRRR